MPACLRGEPFLRLLILICLGLASILAPWDVGRELVVSFLLNGALLAVLCAAAALLVWRARAQARRLVPMIAGFALIFRVALMDAPQCLSSDVYRYVWDVRVQVVVINPYRHAPADPALAGLRDAAIHAHINRPPAPPIYPPGAQLLFRGIYAAWPDRLLAFRAASAGAEALTLIGADRQTFQFESASFGVHRRLPHRSGGP